MGVPFGRWDPFALAGVVVPDACLSVEAVHIVVSVNDTGGVVVLSCEDPDRAVDVGAGVAAPWGWRGAFCGRLLPLELLCVEYVKVVAAFTVETTEHI